jgi:ribosomal-protein-alanine N-acetyltransferase
VTREPAQPVLRTERLVLRPMAPSDVDFVLRHFGDPLVHRYLVDSAPTSTLEDAESIVNFYTVEPSPLRMRWVITTAVDLEPIGTCGYHLRSLFHHRAEVGYDLAPAWWGRGVMSEALAAMLRHGFDSMGLHRISACIHPENAPSLRLAERLGFVREGIARDLFFDGTTYHDHWMLSLMAAELFDGARRT